MPFWDVSGLHPENPAKLVREQHTIGAEVPFPPAKMRDPLLPLPTITSFRRNSFSARLALSQIESCDQGFEHLSPLQQSIAELSPTVWLYSFRPLFLLK